MGDFEWTNDLAIRLMQEYQNRPELWNPKHEMYRVQTLKYESWRELAEMFECDIGDLRKKLNSLFASHRREKSKIRAGGRSSWFLYPHMSFLPTHIETDCYGRNKNQTSNNHPAKHEEAAAAETTDENEDEEDVPMEEEEEVDSEPAATTHILIKQDPDEPAERPRRRQTTHKPRLMRPVKRRKVKGLLTIGRTSTPSTPLEDRLGEALKLLQKADLTRQKDECDSFGEYIASSLRKHDDRTQAMIRQAINNILFEQEMKKYNNQQYTVVISGIDENPLILSDEGGVK